MKKYFLFSMMCFSLVYQTGCGDGCRGATSDKPPVHLVRNMFKQDKGRPQRDNDFFADGRVMRPPVPGTVAIEAAADPNDPFFTGKEIGTTTVQTSPTNPATPAGEPQQVESFVMNNPLPKSMDVLKRGQERYNIYCAPCHGVSGNGQGSVILQAKKGGLGWNVPSYHQDTYRDRQNYPDGKIFNVITNGFQTMPSYKAQIPAEDRWAIVAYLRALQRSQHTRIDTLSPEERSVIP